ncbi:MAG: endonuclease domain-containing protein [Bacteroidetes bacterium]|nr:endonuclease domain-containing protein [Bacteroidota bacterium]
MKTQVHNIRILKENRQGLRNAPTPAEAALWLKLRKSQLDGRKFRRQHSVGTYILDFYCPSEMLGIELDGADHFTKEGRENDAERTAYLNSLNIRVVRFENRLVCDKIEEVLDEIRQYFKKYTCSQPYHSRPLLK